LVLCTAQPSPDTNILHSLEKCRGTSHLTESFAQPSDHLISSEFSLFDRFQRNKHPACIPCGPAASGKCRHGIHSWISHNRVHNPLQFTFHGLKRNILRSLYHSHEPSCILLWKKTFWDYDEQQYTDHNSCQCHANHQSRMLQGPGEASFIVSVQPVEYVLTRSKKPAVRAASFRFQQSSAHHRGRSERYDERNQNGHRQRNREFTKQTA